MIKLSFASNLKASIIIYGILLTFIFLGFPFAGDLGAEAQQPTVFKIQFEWGATSPEGHTFKGNAVAWYAPSSQWTGRVGVNWKAATGKGIDERSPVSMYKGLGSLAAMKPEDVLQFYKSTYSATVTTNNGCSLSDKQTDPPDTYTASITRTKDGAVVEFGTLEAADNESVCDRYDSAVFYRTLAPGQDEVKEKFFTFQLTNDDLERFKTIKKVNNCTLESINPVPSKIWGKATLTAE